MGLYSTKFVLVLLYPILLLQANYGRSDEGCVEKVKEEYESLNLRHLYSEYEDQSYQTISKLIDEHSHILPTHVFLEMRYIIYTRKHKDGFCIIQHFLYCSYFLLLGFTVRYTSLSTLLKLKCYGNTLGIIMTTL